jgi:hypothetical protein
MKFSGFFASRLASNMVSRLFLLITLRLCQPFATLLAKKLVTTQGDS